MSSNKYKNKLRLVTLRAKFILFTGLLSLCIGGFFCAIYLYNTQRTLNAELSKRGISIARNLAYNSKYGVLTKNNKLLQDLLDGTKQESEILMVGILDANLNMLIDRHDHRKIPDSAHERQIATNIDRIKEQEYVYEPLNYNSYNMLCILAQIKARRSVQRPTAWISDDALLGLSSGDTKNELNTREEKIGYVQIFWSMQKVQDEFKHVVYSTLVITTLAVVVSIAMAMLFAGLILKPVKEMRNTALKVAKGDLSLRVIKFSEDELGQFADSFNFMVDSLQKREQELKDTQAQLVLTEKMASLGVLIAGIAHEINTPTGAIANAAMDLAGKVAAFPETLSSLQGLGEDKMQLVYAAVSDFTQERPMLDIRQSSWKRTQQTRQLLADSGIKNDREVAATLEKFGLLEETKIAQYKELLADPRMVAFLDTTGTVAMTQRICQISAQKISQIVKALKYYAYTDMDKTELLDINEGIENVLVLMHNKFKYQFDVEKKYGDIPKIYCTSEINQVWTNLLSNAYDAVMEKGKDYRGKIGIETGEENGYVVVKISDNGVGISPENIAKIFDPFFTTKGIGKGVGLGLSIVSGIVKKHGGNISVESTPEITTFIVSLPKEERKHV